MNVPGDAPLNPTQSPSYSKAGALNNRDLRSIASGTDVAKTLQVRKSPKRSPYIYGVKEKDMQLFTKP